MRFTRERGRRKRKGREGKQAGQGRQTGEQADREEKRKKNGTSAVPAPSPGRSFLPRHRTKRITREKKGNGFFVGSKDISRASFLLLRDGGCGAGATGVERKRERAARKLPRSGFGILG